MTKKRININIFLTGFLGYFVGSIAYSLLGGDNILMKFLCGFIGAGIIGLSYYLYARKRYVKFLEEMKTEEKDERGQFIRGKTSYYTLIFTQVLILSFFIFTLVKDFKLISLLLASSYIIILAFNMLVSTYLSNKL